MSDVEGLVKLKLKYLDTDDPDKREALLKKIEKLKNWEHPRVTEKLKQLNTRPVSRVVDSQPQ